MRTNESLSSGIRDSGIGIRESGIRPSVPGIRSSVSRHRLLAAGALVVLAVVPLAADAARAADPWWSMQFSYRREIVLPKISPTGLGGDDVAVFTMPTAGLCKPDGSDIRVAQNETEVPSRVLRIGPGDQATVAFALKPGKANYCVYFGSDKPPAGKPLDLQRGVLMESWSFDGGSVATLDDVKKAIAASKTRIGAAMRDRIFLGHNPFGPHQATVSLFTGYLRVPKSGAYDIATSSRDASFLLIDDKLVVENGGRHPPEEHPAHKGKIDLTEGLHKIVVYSACTQGNPIIVAAWILPGGWRFEPIAARDFAPFITGEVESLEQYDRGPQLDFLPHFFSEAYTQERYYERYNFEALPRPAGGGPRPAVEWDFGDGTTSTQPKLDHVYLLPGEYTVTLTAKTAAGAVTRTNKIVVNRPWDQVTENKLDSLKPFAEIVAGYDFAKLTPAACAEAMILLGQGGADTAILKAGEALAAAPKLTGEAAGEAMAVYAAAARRTGQRGRAVEALIKAAGVATNAATAVGLLASAGQLALEIGGPDDLKLAQEIFAGTLKKYETMTTAPGIRQAHVGLGDVARARGDLEAATRAYTLAGQGPDAARVKPAILRGDLARHVEAYTRDKDFAAAQQYLDQWADALPLDKLDGYWSLLKARLDAARGNRPAAVAEAQALVKVNPASNYAPQLLLLVADAMEAAQKPADAAAALKQIVEKYPESTLSLEAAKRLQAMGAASAPTSRGR